MKKLILIFSIGAFCTAVQSQDVHLSQFYTAQLNLNPAMGGNYNGEYRLASNYRHQWGQVGDPITTTMIGFDKKFHFFSDEIDAGLLFIQDQFSGFNLNTNKILLSGAYKKSVGYNEFRAGIQFGLVMKSTNMDGRTYPNQWVYESGIFDTNLDPMEMSLFQNQEYIDANFGVAWSRSFAKIKPTIGLSLFHVNNPNDAFSDIKSDNLALRKVFHGEAVMKMKNSIDFEPKLLYMWTTKAQDVLFGANVIKHFKNAKVKNIYGGLLYRGGFDRNPDAAIPIVGVGINNFDIGVSYDVVVSSLNDYSKQKSSFELSLIYTAPTFIPDALSIPCDRF